MTDYPYEVSIGPNAQFPLAPSIRYHKVKGIHGRRLVADCGAKLIQRTRFKPIVCENTMGTLLFEQRRNDCRKCFPAPR